MIKQPHPQSLIQRFKNWASNKTAKNLSNITRYDGLTVEDANYLVAKSKANKHYSAKELEDLGLSEREPTEAEIEAQRNPPKQKRQYTKKVKN